MFLLKFKNYELNVEVDTYNTHIEESKEVKSLDDMKGILKGIREISDESFAIHKRKMWSMINEWRAHNLLYVLGIYQSRTKDVDLEVRSKKIKGFLYDACYFIGSILYLRY